MSSLLPWFLLIAAPIWIGGSYWSYSLLIRHGVLRSSPSLEAESGIDEAPEPNDEQAAEPANDAENSDRLLSKVTPLRRLFSL